MLPKETAVSDAGLQSTPNRTLCRGCAERLLLSVFRATLCALMLTPAGCAICTPSQVFRFTADYNTERRMSMQGEVFEYLPSHPVRVRLNKWAYNVGPQVSTSSIPIPSNSPIGPAPVPDVAPPLPPQPGLTSDPEFTDEDLLEDARPPYLPPAPPLPRIDLRSQQRGNEPNRSGPSARAESRIRGASYQVASPLPSSPPVPSGAWLFGR